MPKNFVFYVSFLTTSLLKSSSRQICYDTCYFSCRVWCVCGCIRPQKQNWWYQMEPSASLIRLVWIQISPRSLSKCLSFFNGQYRIHDMIWNLFLVFQPIENLTCLWPTSTLWMLLKFWDMLLWGKFAFCFFSVPVLQLEIRLISFFL